MNAGLLLHTIADALQTFKPGSKAALEHASATQLAMHALADDLEQCPLDYGTLPNAYALIADFMEWDASKCKDQTRSELLARVRGNVLKLAR